MHRHDSGSAECRAIFEQLSDYIDDQLPTNLCRTLEDHMGECTPCQAFLESLRRTIRLVREVDSPAMPDEIRDSIREAFRRYRRASGRG